MNLLKETLFLESRRRRMDTIFEMVHRQGKLIQMILSIPVVKAQT